MVRTVGKGVLLDAKKAKSLLADFTRNDFKKETNLLKQMLDAGCARLVNEAGDLADAKRALVTRLEDDHGLSPMGTAELLDLLGLVLRGDTGRTVVNGPAPTLAPEGFVWINGGTFTMGSPADEVNRGSAEVQHQVMVSGFYMGKYEVTVGEFQQFVNATGYKTEAETSGGGIVLTGSRWAQKADANWKNPYFKQNENHPVVLVSWNDAVRYCNWRSERDGLSPAYTVNGNNVTWNRSAQAGTAGYHLPTEAEWEYACRAGTTSPFSTGSNITTSQANYNGNGPYNGNAKGTNRERTTNVGSFSPNAFGLYDMHGNVFEWCWDWYGEYSSGAQTTDPQGAVSSAIRVERGGSWDSLGRSLRSAYRYGSSPGNRYGDLGFRLVRL
jgi:formylglycine-generating enzyme required for sulfatase activity